MAVHGRDQSVPRRLGLEIASVAAGIVASQGILAALIANSRGGQVTSVRISVLEAALVFLRHHLAIATCGNSFPFRPPDSGHGPPFATADGHWVEIEVMSGDAWKTFWDRLGVEPAKEVGAAWLPYVYRYLAASCALPASLHAATRRHTLAELFRAAGDAATICRVRSYDDLLRDSLSAKRDATTGKALAALPWSIQSGRNRFHLPQRASAVPNSPLAGRRVIEVTSRLQGPLAGLLLQMLGAEVTKIEPPGGDFGRLSPPLAGRLGAAYVAYNHGKKTIELDYKPPEGSARLTELAAGADIFLHNWKAGRAEELGLDFEHLSRTNPRLVYCHASGWGRMEDPPSPIAGDFLVQAHAACGDGLNPVGEAPFPSRLTLLDVAGGLLACEGILAALCLGERYGCESRVETSLFSAAMSLQLEVLEQMATNREIGRRAGRPLWSPLEQPLKTAEGFLMLALEDVASQEHLLEICSIDRTAPAQAIPDKLAERLHTRTAAEWKGIFRSAGIRCAIVRTNLVELSGDPEIRSLLEQADSACWLPSSPWHFRYAGLDVVPDAKATPRACRD